MERSIYSIINEMKLAATLHLPRNKIGPGKKSVARMHRSIEESKYTGEMLRQIRRDPTKR